VPCFPARTDQRDRGLVPERHQLMPFQFIRVPVNPGSLLGSKMVKEAFGVAGGDIRIGAEILSRAALSDEFAAASGQYFDNDSGQFSSPHPDALDPRKSEEIVRVIETVLAGIMSNYSE